MSDTDPTLVGADDPHRAARAIPPEQVPVENLRCLYILDPGPHRAPLASSLYDLRHYFYRFKRWEEARNAAAESVDLRRLLHAADPEAYRADLASSLLCLAYDLGELKLFHDARIAAVESVDLRLELYRVDPETYRAGLASSLHSIGFYLDKLELWEDARVAGAESVNLRQELYRVDPETYRAKLIEALSLLSSFNWKLGNSAAADLAGNEAVSFLNLTHYNIEIQMYQSIGAGAFGSVYQAKSEKPLYMLWDRDQYDRKLVVKVLGNNTRGYNANSTFGNSFSSDPDVQRQINREITIWYKLVNEGHRNVVGFFGYIILPEGFGLVSEYFSGGNVMLYSNGAASARRVSLCHDVARGLRHLHTFDPPIIHGDMKSLNVVVHEDGHAALCDFGLSYLKASVVQVDSPKKTNASNDTIPQNTGFTVTAPCVTSPPSNYLAIMLSLLSRRMFTLSLARVPRFSPGTNPFNI